LLDATSYAVVAALLTCKLPIFEVQNDKVVDTGNIMPPPITTIPISVTAVRIGDSVLLDPTMEEEACMDARLTITSASDGNLVAAQKGYTGPFTINQILQSVEIARIKGEQIRSTIKGLNETG
jgi:exosome complex component RRP42